MTDSAEVDPLDFGDGPPPLDFGDGVLGRWIVNTDGHRIGVHYSHPMPNPPVPGRRCFGGIYFDGTPGAWQLNSLEPLDVSPSLLCMTCGHHGFIRNGRWIAA